MKVLHEIDGNPVFQVGDHVTVNRNIDCQFGWLDGYMDRYVGGEYLISHMRWLPYNGCYLYRLSGCGYSWDAGCLAHPADFPVDNAALDKFLDLFVR